MHSFLFCHSIQVARKLERVDPVEKLKERQCVSNLVLLQMANEMPAQTRRQFRNFCPRFLHATFSEQCLAHIMSSADFLRVVRLGDRDELDIIY